MAWTVLNPQPAGDELIAVHAALLPTGASGEVVYFGDWSSWPGHTRARVLDLDSEDSTSLPTSELPTTNLFCAGQAFLAEGRLLVAGGRIGGGADLPDEHPIHAGHEPGERACWIYEPRARRWVAAGRLHFQPDSTTGGGGRWYPTLVTLGTGEVWAAAGHPAEDDTFEGRHNNHTPERYAPTGDTWTLLAQGAERTAPAALPTDSYPHYHLRSNGTLFVDTLGRHDGLATVAPRAYHPYSGAWVGPDILPIPDDFYSRGSSCTSVLLPLLPSDGHTQRVLAANGTQAYRITLGGNAGTAWAEVPGRIGTAANQRRDHGYAVLLPTGQVALVGGVQDSRTAAAQPAFQPELYDPGIDWSSGLYLDVAADVGNLGGWVDFGDDPAAVARGYHSTALLLPDGRVWTGGSTEVDSSPFPDQERRMEVWDPPYPAGTRPQIVAASAPLSITYGETFDLEVVTPSGDPIQRIALLRCGSGTHGFDSDQRYVGLDFVAGGELTVMAPPSAEIAPPGFYMLWVVDSAGRPCTQAAFVRVCEQELEVLLERSTISRHEVSALGVPATFVDAFYVVLDGFMPRELGDPVTEPDVSIEWLDGNPVTQIDLVSQGASPEGGVLEDDRSYRVTFAYDLAVLDDSLFDEVPDTPEGLDVRLRVRWGRFEVLRLLRLSRRANPRMNDGQVEWLSTDLRVFQARPGDELAPDVTVGDDPLAFVDELIDTWTGLPADGNHPFLDLPQQMEKSPLELAAEVDGTPVYNFAVAKVRLVAPEQVDAADVRVFFRLFPTWTLGFDYDTETYPRNGDGAQALPGIGKLGGEIRTIPCFGAARGANLIAPGDVNVNRRTLAGVGAQEVHGYFGCWLDFNHDPAVLAELRGAHPCLVAEVHYPDDPVELGATPGSSDNLAQRNLAVVRAPNPPSPATRLVDVTFTVTPSRFPPALPGSKPAPVLERSRHDELMIQWGNLPNDAHVTIYWPDVDVADIVAAAGRRLGPKLLTQVDQHTIRCRVGGTTYIPIPGDRTTDVPGLLTVELPPDIVKGQHYRLVAHQVDGMRRRIIGSVQLDIPVTTAEDILADEARQLAVMRCISQTMRPRDRWRPIFDRWLQHTTDRVRGMGGDPDTIEPLCPERRPRPDRPRPDRPHRDPRRGQVPQRLWPKR